MVENMLCLILFQVSILLDIRFLPVLRKEDIPPSGLGDEEKKIFLRRHIFYDVLSLMPFLLSYFIFTYYWKVSYGKSFILLFIMIALQKTSVKLVRKWSKK